jgi:hypothetical protein
MQLLDNLIVHLDEKITEGKLAPQALNKGVKDLAMGQVEEELAGALSEVSISRD